jgi:carboxyl-terminal processing protease
VDANKASISDSFVSGISYNHNDVDLNNFWRAWDILNDKFIYTATTTSNEDKINGAIKGLAESLGDPYTTYLPPKETAEFTSDLSGSLEGIGAVLSMKSNVLTVTSVIKDSPAEKSGVIEGDKITEVDGKSMAGITIDEAVSQIRGKKGTIVNLLILRDSNNKTIELSIKRESVTIPVVETKKYPNGIFLIKLSSFTSNSAELFRSALREFVNSGDTKLVIDLRNNTGGYLDAAVDICSWFLGTGKIIVTEDFGKKEDPKVYRSKGYNLFSNNMKTVILVNENSASASEIFAGAMRDYDKAILVGTKTYGKGSVQELIPLTDDSMLKVTIARWLTPKGTSISHNGIVPDYTVELTQEDILDKKDPQLDKALEIAGKN